MSQNPKKKSHARLASVINELKAMITARYPNAQFELVRATDEPESVHLVATVDVEDTDEILDLVIDRVLELNVEEGLPLHIIPVQPHERILAAMQPSNAHA